MCGGIKMIYYVEDDQEIRDLIMYTLATSGFEAKGFSNSASFFKELANRLPELIMLDIMLPDEDGLSILKRLKNNNQTKDIPVIMSTAKGSEYDKVIGLEMGADDYLAKPFGMMEMVARIKALLRRAKITNRENDILENGKISMHVDKHIVFVNREAVQLTLKEYDLLRLFLENIDHVFTRNTLLEKIWGQDFIGESRTVDVHVGTLRTKLGFEGNLIQTIRGVGYKMVKENEEANI